jgi:hypothetical protein
VVSGGKHEYSATYIRAINEKTGGMPLYIETIMDYFNDKQVGHGGGGRCGRGGEGKRSGARC